MNDKLKGKAKEIAEIFGYESGSTVEPVNSEEDVRGVERALGVTLPDSYHAFLLYFNEFLPINCGEIQIMTGRRSISGLRYVLPGDESVDPHDDSIMWASDIVEANLQLRETPSWLAKTKAGDEWWEKQPKWPHHLFKIVDSGSDWHYYLDLSRMDATGECPVIVMPPGPAGEIVAANFLEFLRIFREPD